MQTIASTEANRSDLRMQHFQLWLTIVSVLLAFVFNGSAIAQTDEQLEQLREANRLWAPVCGWEFTINDSPDPETGYTPTKVKEGQDTERGDLCQRGAPGGGEGVGDSVLFSSILCYSGEKWACKSVNRSMDGEGGMWRAPQRIQNGPTQGGGRFSYDHALGTLLYIVTLYKRGEDPDNSFANKWQSWADHHRINPLGEVGFCNVDVITEKPPDLLGGITKDLPKPKDLPFSPTIPIFLFPPTVPIAPLPFPNTKFPEDIDKCSISGLAFGWRAPIFDAVYRRIKADQGVFSSSLPWSLNLKIINQQCVEQQGFACHLAAVTSIILQEINAIKFSPYSDVNKDRKNAVPKKFEENPFSLWVKNGLQKSPDIRKITFDKCSEVKPSKRKSHSEWAWERPQGEKEKDRQWLISNGWDCVAMINLLIKPSVKDFDLKDSITESYQKVLNRMPTSEELSSQSSILQKGGFIGKLVIDLTKSPELEQEIIKLFQTLYNRKPTRVEINKIIDELAEGKDISEAFPSQVLFVDSSSKKPINKGTRYAPYTKLKDAIDKADKDAIILLVNGRYPERISINKKIKLKMYGAGSAIIGG